MTQNADILIVGGGLNGCAMALAFAGTDLKITLVDALPVPDRKAPGFDGRSYALALASKRMLSALGLWETLGKHAQPMLQIKASDGRAGQGPAPFFLHFDHAEVGEGPMGFMLEDRFLRLALLDAVAAAPNITHIAGQTVVSQNVGGANAVVALSDGQTIETRLIIGADGRGSGVAQRAKIARTGWDYGQTALVTAIDHALPHNGIAHQFFMPAGPLAILPLPGNRSSIVWSETHGNAAEIQGLSDADYLTVLRPRFGDFLGELALAGTRFTYPLSLSLANSITAPRVALVGDAAHGIHPIAGQGLNLGLRDIGALAEVLIGAERRGEDFASALVLQRYAAWRRFDTAALAMATDGVNKLFSNDNPILRLGRDLGMGVVNALPSLRRGFIREAAGLSGDVPKLLQGRAI